MSVVHIKASSYLRSRQGSLTIQKKASYFPHDYDDVLFYAFSLSTFVVIFFASRCVIIIMIMIVITHYPWNFLFLLDLLFQDFFNFFVQTRRWLMVIYFPFIFYFLNFFIDNIYTEFIVSWFLNSESYPFKLLNDNLQTIFFVIFFEDGFRYIHMAK